MVKIFVIRNEKQIFQNKLLKSVLHEQSVK